MSEKLNNLKKVILPVTFRITIEIPFIERDLDDENNLRAESDHLQNLIQLAAFWKTILKSDTKGALTNNIDYVKSCEITSFGDYKFSEKIP